MICNTYLKSAWELFLRRFLEAKRGSTKLEIALVASYATRRSLQEYMSHLTKKLPRKMTGKGGLPTFTAARKRVLAEGVQGRGLRGCAATTSSSWEYRARERGESEAVWRKANTCGGRRSRSWTRRRQPGRALHAQLPTAPHGIRERQRGSGRN
jgi:hypothetical protein